LYSTSWQHESKVHKKLGKKYLLFLSSLTALSTKTGSAIDDEMMLSVPHGMVILTGSKSSSPPVNF
jgi:hypothetical protein